jgi:hypothetical protein
VATSSRLAPFCGPNTGAAPSRPEQRAVDVGGGDQLDVGQRGSGAPQRGDRRAARPRRAQPPPAASSRCTPRAASSPAPPSLVALPPEADDDRARAGVERRRTSWPDAVRRGRRGSRSSAASRCRPQAGALST